MPVFSLTDLQQSTGLRFLFAAFGARALAQTQRHITAVELHYLHPICEVRHPPPSGWLDEPGRLKGGGVPSPYSNSLKPTIIVTGILVTDRRFDLFQLKANRGDRITTRPKVLARALALMAPKLAGDSNRTSLNL